MEMQYSANGKLITFEQSHVMAIVNVTPDSFYDGGKYDTITDVLNDVEMKISAGASIIDIGAASSRPGAPVIAAETEWSRMVPALEAIRKQFPEIVISIDTCYAQVAAQAADYGADIINDISGGRADQDMFKTISRLSLPYVLMHMDGNPQTMKDNPAYPDVVNSVNSFFSKSIESLESLGFNKIILDPGIGFGKSLENNYELLGGLSRFAGHGYPLLVGVSRKSMINKIIKTNPVTALNGTTVLNTIAMLNGAKIIRVHDVTEAIQVRELVGFYKKCNLVL